MMIVVALLVFMLVPYVLPLKGSERVLKKPYILSNDGPNLIQQLGITIDFSHLDKGRYEAILLVRGGL